MPRSERFSRRSCRAGENRREALVPPVRSLANFLRSCRDVDHDRLCQPSSEEIDSKRRGQKGAEQIYRLFSSLTPPVAKRRRG